jgi:hypothetical protein
MQHIAQTLMNSGMGRVGALPQQLPQSGPLNQLSSITNDQGQSLLDIRGELQGAVKEAIQGADGSGDFRATIEGAIHSTLEEHGFNPEEVKGAMQDAGFGSMQAMAGRGGSPMAAMLGGGSGGFDPSTILQSGGTEEDLVQSFLQQFRAGVHLDLEG